MTGGPASRLPFPEAALRWRRMSRGGRGVVTLRSFDRSLAHWARDVGGGSECASATATCFVDMHRRGARLDIHYEVQGKRRVANRMDETCSLRQVLDAGRSGVRAGWCGLSVEGDSRFGSVPVRRKAPRPCRKYTLRLSIGQKIRPLSVSAAGRPAQLGVARHIR